MEINDILANSSYVLRVYELKRKFRHLSWKNKKKQTIARQLSSCIHEKLNGSNIIRTEYSKKLRKKFKAIDIIYKPVKSLMSKLNFTFHKIYREPTEIRATRWKLLHGFANQCYYCGKLFARSDKQKQHMEHCSGVSGIVYDFNNQNLVTFEDNLGYKGNLPVVAYIDFETTAPYWQLFWSWTKKDVCCVLRYHTCFSSKIKNG